MKTRMMMIGVLFGLALVGCTEEEMAPGGGATGGGAAGAAMTSSQPPSGGAAAATPVGTGAAGTGAGTGSSGPAGTSGSAGAGDSGGASGAAGSGGATPATSVGRFIGTWKFTSGTTTRICAGLTDTFQLAGGDMEFARSLDGGLTLKGACTPKLSIDGETASAASGASCTSVADDGSSSTTMFGSLTFTTLDGRNMTVSGSGTQTFLADGQSLACTFSTNGNLMKYAE